MLSKRALAKNRKNLRPSRLTIVMPTYNRAELLRKNIDSLLKSSYDFELLIVDDGSTDDTQIVVQSFKDPRITYLKHSSNCGYGKSLNDGIIHARNHKIMLCEDDAFILNPDDFFEILVSELDSKTIVATHLLINGKEKKPNFLNRIKRFFGESLAKEVYNYNGNKRCIVRFCNNCFGFDRNKINTRFEESDYIGNVFRIESDFQIRARREGAKIVYNPKLTIDHKRYPKGGLRISDGDKFLYLQTLNHLIFLKKHYSFWNIFMYVLLALLSHPKKRSIIKKALKIFCILNMV